MLGDRFSAFRSLVHDFPIAVFRPALHKTCHGVRLVAQLTRLVHKQGLNGSRSGWAIWRQFVVSTLGTTRRNAYLVAIAEPSQGRFEPRWKWKICESDPTIALKKVRLRLSKRIQHSVLILLQNQTGKPKRHTEVEEVKKKKSSL